jgi:hypothetical protein
MTEETTSTEEATTEQTTVETVTSTEEARPDWLPEKFKTGEDLSKAYTELSSKLGQRDEDLLTQFNADRMKDRPEKPGDYILPDSVEPTAMDHNLMKWWAEHSHEQGYGQEQFEAGIRQYQQAIQAAQPDIENEARRLGDNATARAEAASLFATRYFPREVLPAIERMMETAEGVMALEFMIEQQKQPALGNDTSTPSALTKSDLMKMMQDPRYHSMNAAMRDDDYIKKVNDGWKRLVGNG